VFLTSYQPQGTILS